jgi:hypothetical protein
MMVTKTKAAEAVPHQPIPLEASATAAPTGDAGLPKALTVKLDGRLYKRLRNLARAREDSTGRRVSHQEIMVEALLSLLEKEGC